jgi:hypothetical protein
MKKLLLSYFRDGIEKSKKTIGMEVETSFLSIKNDKPASVEESQNIFITLLKDGWQIEQRKGCLISAIKDVSGNKILYELGRQNIEVSTIPSTASGVIKIARKVLVQLYEAATRNGLTPIFEPILASNEDLLVIPDQRDLNWIRLDGREALIPLAKISAVQFTVEIEQKLAINLLNQLGSKIDTFLADYPQDKVWQKYIQSSNAGYQSLRYGGPLHFKSFPDYCERLLEHDVVQGSRLVPYSNVGEIDIPLFLRSIWWYFRLRRYGNRLCIEVRPFPRREDELFEKQLSMVLDVINS